MGDPTVGRTGKTGRQERAVLLRSERMHCHGGQFDGDSCFVPGVVYLYARVGFLYSYACFLCFSADGVSPLSKPLLAISFCSGEKPRLRVEQEASQRKSCCPVISVSIARMLPGDLAIYASRADAGGDVSEETPGDDSSRNLLRSVRPVHALSPCIVNLAAWSLIISLRFPGLQRSYCFMKKHRVQGVLVS